MVRDKRITTALRHPGTDNCGKMPPPLSLGARGEMAYRCSGATMEEVVSEPWHQSEKEIL